MQNADEALPSISPVGIRSISENAQNSLTTWYTLIRFCILLIHFNIDTDILNGEEA